MNAAQHVMVTTITPDMAGTLLRGNKRNRPISKEHVMSLARAMAGGEWKLNYETIKVASDGTLLDGQHRLNAVLQSEQAVPMAIAYGVDVEAFDSIDIGRRRSGSDTLSVLGVDNYKVIASGIRVAAGIETAQRGGQFGRGRRLSNVQTRQYLEANPAIADYVEASRAVKIMNVGTTLGCLYVFSRADEARAREFGARLADGAGLDDGNVILLLRNVLMNYKARGKNADVDIVVPLIIKAWNAYVLGRRMQLLKFTSNESFPTVVGWKG